MSRAAAGGVMPIPQHKTRAWKACERSEKAVMRVFCQSAGVRSTERSGALLSKVRQSRGDRSVHEPRASGRESGGL